MAREWWKYTCRFCGKEAEEFEFIPPNCECDGYKEAQEKWLEEYRSQPDYKEPLEPEDYEKKYPQVYFGERLVLDKDGSHKLKLEARSYEDGEGLCVWIPFPKIDKDGTEEEDEGGGGLCWDFTDRDAEALHSMLSEYLENKKCR